jgi:hypothetical protein
MTKIRNKEDKIRIDISVFCSDNQRSEFLDMLFFPLPLNDACCSPFLWQWKEEKTSMMKRETYNLMEAHYDGNQRMDV